MEDSTVEVDEKAMNPQLGVAVVVIMVDIQVILLDLLQVVVLDIFLL